MSVDKSRVSRRGFLRYAALGTGATLLAACQPQAAPAPQGTGGESNEPKVVEKIVTATLAPQVTKLVVNAYTPSEWTERSAEHPTVVNAPRVLAEKFKEVEPNIEIEWLRYSGSPEGAAGDTYYGAWCDALVAAGSEPDIIDPLHEIPIYKGYCMPVEEYLDQPNPYAPDYATWKDSFYPSVMKAAVYADGHIYCIPVSDKIANFEIGMMCNMDWFKKIGMEPPTTWTEQLEVGQALKEAGSSWIPWPPEAKEGNIWALGLQLLPSILQPECALMDTNGDLFVGAEEALPAFREGLVGPLTEKYQAAWRQQKAVTAHWADGWASADLEVMWRQGQIGMRQTGGWEITAQLSDPQMKFERVIVPPASVTSADLPEASDPPEWTAGDGKVPEGWLVRINGPDTAVMKVAQQRGTVDAAIKWLQWITEPENNAFLVNENEELVPCAKDAPLGPVWSGLMSYKLPKWKYSIAWWGECLQFDNTLFNEVRKLFVAWATGQMDDETFFRRQHEETAAGADRYEASIKALQEG